MDWDEALWWILAVEGYVLALVVQWYGDLRGWISDGDSAQWPD